MDRQAISEARIAAERATAMDANALEPLVLLGFCHILDVLHGYSRDRRDSREAAMRCATEALVKEESDATVQRLAALVFSSAGQLEKALAHCERALELNPYDGDVLIARAGLFRLAGDYENAIAWYEKALRYNPHAPPFYRAYLALAQLCNGDVDAALANLQRLERTGDQFRYVLAIALVRAGRDADAAEQVRMIQAEQPEMTVVTASKLFPAREREAFMASLRAAGMPEGN